MINLPAILIGNGSAFLLLLILLFASRKTVQNRLPDNMFFLTMVFSAMLQCITETLSFIVDGKNFPGMYIIIVIVNSLLFVNNIFFAFVWTVYADYKLFSDLKRIKHIYSFISIPALLIILGAFVNLFYPIYFSVSAANVYQRSRFFIIPYIVTYFYLAYGVILIYKNRNKGSRYLFLPALQFILPIILGSVLQFVFYGVSIIWICVAISLVSIYINLQNEVAYTDAVSGMFTRQYLNRFLEIETHRTGQKKNLAGIMLDIDNFKSINDNFGHLTGDDAIRSAAMILHSCVSSPEFIARFAGDEFVAILFVNNKSEIENMMQKIKECTARFNSSENKPYSIHFSMGCSMYDPNNDTPDTFINRMDRKMYEDKRENRLLQNSAIK